MHEVGLDALIFVHGKSPHQPMQSIESLIGEYQKQVNAERVNDFTWELLYQNTFAEPRQTPYYSVIEPGENGTERHLFDAFWSPLAKHKIPIFQSQFGL
jgi:hypothetical protein